MKLTTLALASAFALSGERTPVINAARMVEQQPGLGIPDQLRDLTSESTVGNADSLDRERSISRNCHCASPAGRSWL